MNDRRYQLILRTPNLNRGRKSRSTFRLNDENLRLLDQAFPETRFNARGERVKLSGPDAQMAQAQLIIKGMVEVAIRGKDVREGDVKTLIRLNGKARQKR